MTPADLLAERDALLGIAQGMRPVDMLADPATRVQAQRLVAGGKAQAFDGVALELAFQSQRAFNGDLPVAEVGVVKPLAFGHRLRFVRIGGRLVEVVIEDPVNVRVRQLAVLLTQVAPHRLEPLRGVNQLHFALAMREFFVG